VRPKSGRLRRIGRIALYGVIGFIIGSIVAVGLYRALQPPGTPLMRSVLSKVTASRRAGARWMTSPRT
jgi:hypothetical protein